MRIPVKVSGDPVPAGKMQSRPPIAQGFKPILATQHVKVRSAHAHVFIQRCWWNRLRRNSESQSLLWFPRVHRLKERQASFKRRIADSTHSFMGKRGLNRIRKSDAMTPCRGQFLTSNSRHTLNVAPYNSG